MPQAQASKQECETTFWMQVRYLIPLLCVHRTWGHLCRLYRLSLECRRCCRMSRGKPEPRPATEARSLWRGAERGRGLLPPPLLTKPRLFTRYIEHIWRIFDSLPPVAGGCLCGPACDDEAGVPTVREHVAMVGRWRLTVTLPTSLTEPAAAPHTSCDILWDAGFFAHPMTHIAQCAALSNTCVRPLALQHRYRVSGPRISTASRSCPCNLLSHAIQHFLIDNRAEHNTTISSFFSIQILNACIHWIWSWRPGGNTWIFRGEWSSNLHDIICLSINICGIQVAFFVDKDDNKYVNKYLVFSFAMIQGSTSLSLYVLRTTYLL